MQGLIRSLTNHPSHLPQLKYLLSTIYILVDDLVTKGKKRGVMDRTFEVVLHNYKRVWNFNADEL